jgi:hypothetical protein
MTIEKLIEEQVDLLTGVVASFAHEQMVSGPVDKP